MLLGTGGVLGGQPALCPAPSLRTRLVGRIHGGSRCGGSRSSVAGQQPSAGSALRGPNRGLGFAACVWKGAGAVRRRGCAPCMGSGGGERQRRQHRRCSVAVFLLQPGPRAGHGVGLQRCSGKASLQQQACAAALAARLPHHPRTLPHTTLPACRLCSSSSSGSTATAAARLRVVPRAETNRAAGGGQRGAEEQAELHKLLTRLREDDVEYFDLKVGAGPPGAVGRWGLGAGGRGPCSSFANLWQPYAVMSYCHIAVGRPERSSVGSRVRGCLTCCAAAVAASIALTVPAAALPTRLAPWRHLPVPLWQAGRQARARTHPCRAAARPHRRPCASSGALGGATTRTTCGPS